MNYTRREMLTLCGRVQIRKLSVSSIVCQNLQAKNGEELLITCPRPLPKKLKVIRQKNKESLFKEPLYPTVQIWDSVGISIDTLFIEIREFCSAL
ncbi:hypothetical protein HHUSO_G28145 [Huso huso]|uniref:Uncharacterized protein n=1 Tax=Huso huso TaxID=61971 RepID=A0ABR0YJ40_HUSHU